MSSSHEKPVLSRAQIKYVWIGVAVIVLVGWVGVTPWDAIRMALAGEGASAMAFAAGFSLPLFVGTACSVGLLLWNRAQGNAVKLEHLALVGVILIVAGLLSHYLGLGLAPDFTEGRVYGPVYVALPLMAITAYLNTYGVGLTMAAVSLGTALALHVDAWRTDPGSIPGDAASLLKPE